MNNNRIVFTERSEDGKYSLWYRVPKGRGEWHESMLSNVGWNFYVHKFLTEVTTDVSNYDLESRPDKPL